MTRDDPCDELPRSVWLYLWLKVARERGDARKAYSIKGLINAQYGTFGNINAQYGKYYYGA